MSVEDAEVAIVDFKKMSCGCYCYAWVLPLPFKTLDWHVCEHSEDNRSLVVPEKDNNSSRWVTEMIDMHTSRGKAMYYNMHVAAVHESVNVMHVNA